MLRGSGQVAILERAYDWEMVGVETYPLSLVSISGKVNGSFAELELGNWKIVAGSNGKRSQANRNEPAAARVPLGGPCAPSKAAKESLTLSARGFPCLRTETSQQAGS